jgi:hypothetical protein
MFSKDAEAEHDDLGHASYEQILEEYEKFFSLDEEIIK